MNNNKTIYPASAKLKGLVGLMRPKQWIKNVFVLAPLLFSGEFLNPDSVIHAFVATLLFCMASSAAYIINDIHDIEHDRLHPVKSKIRPLAARTVSLLLYFFIPKKIFCCLIYSKCSFLYSNYLANIVFVCFSNKNVHSIHQLEFYSFFVRLLITICINKTPDKTPITKIYINSTALILLLENNIKELPIVMINRARVIINGLFLIEYILSFCYCFDNIFTTTIFYVI